MAQRVVLHVGSMKSGTTYLQNLVGANRDVLADAGLLFPGKVWKDQVTAVADVLDRDRVAAAPEGGDWQRMVAEIDAWPGTALVSMEWLGPAGPRKVEKVVGSFAPGTVRVVVTARDLNRQIPAMWQEGLKNGRTWEFGSYVESVRTQDGPGKAFWREQGVAAICRKWADAAGVDHLRLVTVPPPGAPRDLLWRRFAEAADLDVAGLDLAEAPASNPSLGAASAEVLRRLNASLEDLDFPQFAPVVKHRLAKKTLGPRRADEPAVGLDVPSWLPEASDAMIGRLRELGVPVVGDLADLTPVPVPGVDPAGVPAEERLDAAIAGLEGLARALVRQREKQK